MDSDYYKQHHQARRSSGEYLLQRYASDKQGGYEDSSDEYCARVASRHDHHAYGHHRDVEIYHSFPERLGKEIFHAEPPQHKVYGPDDEQYHKAVDGGNAGLGEVHGIKSHHQHGEQAGPLISAQHFGQQVHAGQHQNPCQCPGETPAEGGHTEDGNGPAHQHLAKGRMGGFIGAHAVEVFIGRTGMIDFIEVRGIIPAGHIASHGIRLVADIPGCGVIVGGFCQRGRDDFATFGIPEEDFEKLKEFSDQLYLEEQRSDVTYNKHVKGCVDEMEDSSWLATDSFEKELLDKLEDESLEKIMRDYMAEKFTEVQRRRFLMYLNGISTVKIAEIEGCNQNAVWKSIVLLLVHILAAYFHKVSEGHHCTAHNKVEFLFNILATTVGKGDILETDCLGNFARHEPSFRCCPQGGTLLRGREQQEEHRGIHRHSQNP